MEYLIGVGLAVAALAGHGAFDFVHISSFRIPVFRCGGPASAFRSTFSPPVSLPCC